MRAVIQRASKAEVSIDNRSVRTGKGYVVFLGVGSDDSDSDIEYIVNKIIRLRVFEDQKGKMDLSITDIGGEILFISQFTLYGDCRKGNRPSFDGAANFEYARKMYEKAAAKLIESGISVKTGFFGEFMDVRTENSGPVTILLDSKKVF